MNSSTLPNKMPITHIQECNYPFKHQSNYTDWQNYPSHTVTFICHADNCNIVCSTPGHLMGRDTQYLTTENVNQY